MIIKNRIWMGCFLTIFALSGAAQEPSSDSARQALSQALKEQEQEARYRALYSVLKKYPNYLEKARMSWK